MTQNYKSSFQDRERARQYYEKNKQQCLRKRATYYALNKKKILAREKCRQSSPDYKKKKREYDDQRYNSNKEQIKQKRRVYYHCNREKAKNYLLKRKYNITLNDYLKKWSEQNGKCAICQKGQFPFEKMFDRVLVLDHDHKTNQVRGLLCNSCNRALGLLKDNPVFTQNATTYLNQWKSYVSSQCNKS